MNIFQLVLKQMRQRALSTWLTLLSVALGVALTVAILIVRRESWALFGQTDYGFDLVVGPKGSPLQLVLNTIYHTDTSPGNIPWSIYEDLAQGRLAEHVEMAVPYAVGDSYEGYRIVGTLPKLFGEAGLEYRPGRKYALAEGRIFHGEKFEAVIGSEVARRTGLTLGSTFRATHGLPAGDESAHVHEQQWTVVGILEPTRTANDKVLFIPLVSFYAMGGHDEALVSQALLKEGVEPAKLASPTTAPHAHEEHEHADHVEHEAHGEHEEHAAGHEHAHAHVHGYDLAADGTINLHVPRDYWQVSAILVRSKTGHDTRTLMFIFNNRPEAAAVIPAMVMREFFQDVLGTVTVVLLAISAVVTVVAAVGILVSIYNSVAARVREIAILRALGATRMRVLTIICLEAGLVGLLGGMAGLAAGHLGSGALSLVFRNVLGQGINWLTVGNVEWIYLGAVVVIAALAGLAPALKAYRTPVADNLVR